MSDESDQTVDNTDIVKMIIAMQEKSNSKRNSISISSNVAVSWLIGVIVVLIQIIYGVGIWSITDKLDRYDSYDDRITKVENSVIKLESVADQLGELIIDFKTFSAEPRFTESKFNERFTDKILPLTNQLDRIETKLNERAVNVDSKVSDHEGRIRSLENEVEFNKRVKDVSK